MNNTLSDSTKIPLKAALPVIGTVIVATLWITSKISALQSDQRVAAIQQDYLRDAMGELKLDVQEVRLSMLNDRWSRSDMERWAAQVRLANPSLVIPSPGE